MNKQEPVAWLGFNDKGECREVFTKDMRKLMPYYNVDDMTPVYTHPAPQPAQEPVAWMDKKENVTIKCAGCGNELEECEQCLCYEKVNKMADRFLYWELPESVRADDCATRYGAKNRRGTNLLNVDEARLMVRHILGHKHDK